MCRHRPNWNLKKILWYIDSISFRLSWIEKIKRKKICVPLENRHGTWETLLRNKLCDIFSFIIIIVFKVQIFILPLCKLRVSWHKLFFYVSITSSGSSPVEWKERTDRKSNSCIISMPFSITFEHLHVHTARSKVQQAHCAKGSCVSRSWWSLLQTMLVRKEVKVI